MREEKVLTRLVYCAYILHSRREQLCLRQLALLLLCALDRLESTAWQVSLRSLSLLSAWDRGGHGGHHSGQLHPDASGTDGP